MPKIYTALATSVDGYITGPNRGPDQPLGDGGTALFDWYASGDVAIEAYPSFSLHAPSAEVFDALVRRTGALIAGRNTYDDVDGWGGGGPHPHAALVVLSHRPPPPSATDVQHFAPYFSQALREAKELAGEKDIGLMGSGPIVAALAAGVLDEVTVHRVPALLGGGTPLFPPGCTPARLELQSVATAPDVTHLTYTVVRPSTA